MTNPTKITTLETLPATISADTEVCIPGYHLEKSGDNLDPWILVHTDTGAHVRLVRVQW